jgi:hypothetical protein
LYDESGKYTGGRTQSELDDLACDPAHKGSTRISDIEKGIHEREVGLGLEENGMIDGPIIRDPTDNAEFIDANGQAWDVKSFYSAYKPKGYNLNDAIENINKSIEKNEYVIIDTTYLDEIDLQELLNAIEELNIKEKILVW